MLNIRRLIVHHNDTKNIMFGAIGTKIKFVLTFDEDGVAHGEFGPLWVAKLINSYDNVIVGNDVHDCVTSAATADYAIELLDQICGSIVHQKGL